MGSNPYGVAFNPSGTLAYATNENNPGTVNVIQVSTNTVVNTGPANSIYGTWSISAFAEDNATNIYAYGSNTILLSNTITIESTPHQQVQTSGCGNSCSTGSGGTISETGVSSSISTTSVATTSIPAASTTIIQKVIKVSISPQGQTTQQLCNGTYTIYNISYTSIGANFEVFAKSGKCFVVTAVNVTNTTNVISNNGKVDIKALNLTVIGAGANTIVNATVSYSCNYPYYSVAPYMLTNNVWNKITPFYVNSSACTVSFSVPSDPVIAIFANQSTNSQITTTIAQQSKTEPKRHYSILLVVIVLIIAAILIVAYKRRHKRNRPRRRS